MWILSVSALLLLVLSFVNMNHPSSDFPDFYLLGTWYFAMQLYIYFYGNDFNYKLFY